MFPQCSAGLLKNLKKTNSSSTSIKNQSGSSTSLKDNDSGIIVRGFMACVSQPESIRGRLGIYNCQRVRFVFDRSTVEEFGEAYGHSPYVSAQGSQVGRFFSEAEPGWFGKLKLYKYVTRNGSSVLNFKKDSWLIREQLPPVDILSNWRETFTLTIVTVEITNINPGYYCHCLQFRYTSDGVCRSCKIPHYLTLENNLHSHESKKVARQVDDDDVDYCMLSGNVVDSGVRTENFVNVLLHDALVSVDAAVQLSIGSKYQLECVAFTGYLKFVVSMKNATNEHTVLEEKNELVEIKPE